MTLTVNTQGITGNRALELNIAVVDDTLSDVFRLKSFVESWFAASEHRLTGITAFTGGEEMLRTFEPKMFQIVFMDIIMNTLNGVETAKKLRAEDTELLIVFTTTSREYAFDTFPVHPFDYVLKPYGQKDVAKVLEEALRVLSAEEPSVTVRVSHSEYTIPLRLIISVVSRDHFVEINLAGGKCLLSGMRFREAEKIFAEYPGFILCNRGIIVNMSHISAQEQGTFIMKNGTRYPIRVAGQSKIKAAFSEYLIQKLKGDSE